MIPTGRCNGDSRPDPVLVCLTAVRFFVKNQTLGKTKIYKRLKKKYIIFLIVIQMNL